MKITAIIAVRNEERYLRIVLKHLVGNNIRLAILDNESTDATSSILDDFKDSIDYYKSIPFNGYFNLSEQIRVKSEVIRQLDTDWIIHQDADEILESPIPFESLRVGIERVAMQGNTAINFNEFVFVPTLQQPDFENRNYYKYMLNYYFFEPKPFRLMRAWKNSLDISMNGGGHALKSENPLIFPSDSFILRHYFVLSQNHAKEKYSKRVFANEDLAKGWHQRRLNAISYSTFLNENDLNKLPYYNSKTFIRSNPWNHHYWQVNV